MELVYRPVVGFAVGFFKVMGWRVLVDGAEHVPAQGGAVIAANHIGYLDFTFLGYGVRERKRLVRFLAKKEVFDHPISGPLMRGMKHLPVDRFGRPAVAVATAVEALRRGELLGMFPEGTISRSFLPRTAKNGAARIAMSAGVPIIPAAVWGSQRLLTKGRPRNWQRGVPIMVAYGAPITPDPDADPNVVTEQVMSAIAGLADRLMRTYPDTPADDEDRWWLPAHLGGTAPTVEQADAMAQAEEAARRARHMEERKRQRQARAQRRGQE